MSKSKATANRIEVVKRINLGHIPLFIQLAHKGFEKTNPTGEIDLDDTNSTRFNLAKDMLQISVDKPELLAEIDHIDVVYEKAKV